MNELLNLDILAGQFIRRHSHIRRFFNGLKEPRRVQEAFLQNLIKTNADTSFGRAHHFDKINSLQDFRRRVPACGYDYFEPYIESLCKGGKRQLTVDEPFMFATTSGTTAKPKFVPINKSHVRDYTHAFQVHNYHLIKDHPRGAFGKFLIITSNDEEGRTECGLPYGAVSGMLNRNQSPVIRRHFALPFELCQIKDVDAKYYLLLRAALVQNVSAMLGCNPSSFLLLADQLRHRAECLIDDIARGAINPRYTEGVSSRILKAFTPYLKPDASRAAQLASILEKEGQILPKQAFPNVEVFSCWKGGPMGFYLEQLPELYGDLQIRDFGYMASEGRGTVPIDSKSAAGPLAVTSHFFEFVHEDDIENASPRFLLADELKKGERYFVYFTTSAGLYRYNINDLMLVEDFLHATPVLSFVRKGGGVSSVTGEKITEEQVLAALKGSVAKLDLSEIKHFTAEVVLDRPPYYLCYAEVDHSAFGNEDFERKFLQEFDRHLKENNQEYCDKRDSRRLGPPRLQLLKAGTYARLRQMRVMEGAPEAQVKIPLLSQGGIADRIAAL